MINLFNSILDRMPIGSVIAGGAVRDYVLGMPHRDIDVFIPHHVVVEGELWDAADPRFRFTTRGWRFDETYARTIRAGNHEYDQMEAGHILGVSLYHDQDNNQINLIELNADRAIQDHLDAFDLGICQAAYAGGGVQLSDNFLRDWKDRRVTLVNPNARTTERLERFQQRARDWGYHFQVRT